MEAPKARESVNPRHTLRYFQLELVILHDRRNSI